MKKNTSSAVIISVVLVCAVSFALIGASVRYFHSAVIIGSEPTTLIEVPEGYSFSKTMFDLHQKGKLRFPRLIIWYARIHGKAGLIKAGEYEINKGSHAYELIQQLSEGHVLKRTVTFVEGITFRMMRSELEQAIKLKQNLKNITDEEVMKRIGADGVKPEGNFFPDTYQYHLGMSDENILRIAYKKMQKTIETEWENKAADLPYHSAYEALTMASIVEKETGLEQEREKIAGVFIRRLQQGMLLQTDPTVIYGLGEKYDGNLHKADLQIDSKYNTYKYTGLPPTPIAMPGLGAIHAALNPEPGNSLYFVAKGDGSHEFSDSLQQHNTAVKKYQLNRRSNYHSAPIQHDHGDAP